MRNRFSRRFYPSQETPSLNLTGVDLLLFFRKKPLHQLLLQLDCEVNMTLRREIISPHGFDSSQETPSLTLIGVNLAFFLHHDVSSN